jgi:Spy/CpxP family protein refolding chaperone
MKSSIKTAGIMLMLVVACSLSVNAQRGMRGAPDSLRMNRPMPGYGRNQPVCNCMRDMGGMRGMGNMRGMGSMRGMGDMKGMGDMRGMRGDHFGMRPPMDGRMRIESLDLTEKQKTDIAALREKQQAEMKKLKDDFSVKMQALREEQRKKVTDLLTDEQKKQLEAAGSGTSPVTPKAK